MTTIISFSKIPYYRDECSRCKAFSSASEACILDAKLKMASHVYVALPKYGARSKNPAKGHLRCFFARLLTTLSSGNVRRIMSTSRVWKWPMAWTTFFQRNTYLSRCKSDMFRQPPLVRSFTLHQEKTIRKFGTHRLPLAQQTKLRRRIRNPQRSHKRGSCHRLCLCRTVS